MYTGISRLDDSRTLLQIAVIFLSTKITNLHNFLLVPALISITVIFFMIIYTTTWYMG